MVDECGSEMHIEVGPRPLQLPEVLWNGLSHSEQETYQVAQHILERMIDLQQGKKPRWPRSVTESGEHLVGALRLLDRFGLVKVEQEGKLLRLGLLATPEEHIRVPHPSGGHRWVFIARPIHEPEVDPGMLN